jgi:hypothetical protein
MMDDREARELIRKWYQWADMVAAVNGSDGKVTSIRLDRRGFAVVTTGEPGNTERLAFFHFDERVPYPDLFTFAKQGEPKGEPVNG